MQDQEIVKYTVYGNRGEFSVINYGATLVSLIVSDKRGNATDVVLGYDDLSSYAAGTRYFGGSIGRVANRIGGACFSFGGKVYELSANENGNTLHGGFKGFDKRVWKSYARGDRVIMTYFSEDGEEGFPGALEAIAEFYFGEDNALHITYTAETDSESPVNLTNHAYFNLNGEGKGSIEDHTVEIRSSCFTPIGGNMITTGEFRDLSSSPFDFTRPKKIGADIDAEDEQLAITGGYDHNYVLDLKENDLAAIAVGDKSGIAMKVYTNQNGVQFYSGNFLGKERGKGGRIYDRRGAFCLMTQSFPNALNVPSFGQPIIRNGEIYQNRTVYSFSIIGDEKG